MADTLSQSPRGAVENRTRETARIAGADEIPQLAGTAELAIRDASTVRQRVGAVVLARECRAQVRQVVETIEQEPRAKTVHLAHERAGLRHASPDDRVARVLRPHRHDAGRRVPPPQPLFLDGAR